MVVFIMFVILIIVFITITACFSVIKLELIDFTIKDYENLVNIIKLIKDKKYAGIFEHIDFILKLRLCVLKKFSIINFKISDEGIAKFLRKQIRKNKLKKEEKEIKKYAEEDEKQIENDIPDINIEKFQLLMNIGTDNASFTALFTTTITIFISILLPLLVDEVKKENYNYEINPIYSDKSIFNVNASLILSIPALDIIKLIR